MPDDDTGERTEKHALDQCHRLREARGTRSEGSRHTADKAAGNEQRPAFNVDGAYERREDRGGENEPRRGLTQCRSSDARYEECGDAKLCDRQRGGLAH